MRALFAVYKRELGLFFRSTIAYAISFGVLLFLGLILSSGVTQAVFAAQQQQGIPADFISIQVVGVLAFLMFIIAPLLTMRLLSEEAREGTLEVLMTLPMGDWAFVIGKFLAAWTVFTFLLALTGVHVILLTTLESGALDGGRLLSAYLGTWLYGGAALAVTLIWSAVTEDQIVAAFLGAASILVLYMADAAAQLIANQESIAGAADFVRELSLYPHYYETLQLGIIRGEDVAYFVLLTIAALFITTLIVGIRRWRAN